jgi:hypothetical protein
MRPKHPAHPILLDLIILIVFVEEWTYMHPLDTHGV